MLNVTQGEHYTWGPRPTFGGGFTDARDEQRARADLPRYESELARLCELAAFDRSLEADAAYASNLVAWTKRRLDALDTQRAEARRQAIYEAQEAETRAKHGLPPKPRDLSPDELRDDRHQAEMAALAAQQAKLTKQELDALDPNMKTKAELKAELDARDPVLQAKLTGKPMVDAITAARAQGRPL